MANPLETGLRYVGSVAARSVGINAFRRWQRYAVEHFEPTSDAYRNRKDVGVFIGLIQFGTEKETNINPIIFMAKHSITPVAD